MMLELSLFIACAVLPCPSVQTPATTPPQEGEGQITEMDQEVPLTLEQALEIALRRDINLQIGELSVDVARFNYEGSWGAFDPVFSAQGSYTDAESELRSSIFGDVTIEDTTLFGETGVLFPLRTGGSFEVLANISSQETNEPFTGANELTTNNVALTFTQPLLQGAGSDYAESTQREAKLDFRRELEVMRASRQDLLASVENAYWDLVAALRQLDVADESLELSRQQLEQNQRRLDAGVGTQVEVLQSEANEATKIEQRLLRDVESREAQDILKGFLQPGTSAVYWSARLVPLTPLPEVSVLPIPDWREAMVTALDRRPELRRDRVSIDIADERLGRAESERQAQLDLNLSSRGRGLDKNQGEAFATAVSFEFPTHTAALTYRLPIGNRAASNAERAARANLRSARLVHDAQESKVVEEVRGAVRRLRYAVEAAAAASKSSELALQQLSAEQARYREGLSTNFQVLEFQEQLSTAQFNHTQAMALFAKAHVRLRRDMGVLGEKQP